MTSAGHGVIRQWTPKMVLKARALPMLVQVYPKDAQLKCTFTSWAPVCQYILSQLTVDPSSDLLKKGVCIPIKA